MLNKRRQLAESTAKLDALSPLKVMARGFSVASGTDGHIIRSKSELSEGDRISLRLSDGCARCVVDSID